MRTTNEIFIPVPKKRDTHVLVNLKGDDITGKMIASDFIKPVSSGIGTFSAKISNAGGVLSDKYANGDEIKFYADNLDNTTLQFWGHVDYVKDDISNQGQYLIVEGRHRSYLLTEYLVCYSSTGETTSEILENLIDKLPTSYGFTKTNISVDTTTMDVKWNYKPFWQCVIELCNKAGFDCYVDDALDFHYFEQNSILNTDDAVFEGYNFLGIGTWGTDDYPRKTRVTVMGQDSDGLPIIYTAIDPDEGTNIREIFEKHTSADTELKVKNTAEARLLAVTNQVKQATVKAHGLENVSPGDNIWFIVPRQKIAGQYKLAQINHKFGAESAGWRTELAIEKHPDDLGAKIYSLSNKITTSILSENPNKLNYSYNFNFDADVNFESHTNTKVANSKLLLSTDSASDGTWISTKKTSDELVTKVELRILGKDIWDSEFYFSLNDGGTWEQIAVGDLSTEITPGGAGKDIKIKIKLSRPSGWGLNPEIESLALLYS